MRSALAWWLAWPALTLAQPTPLTSTAAPDVPAYIAREVSGARLAGRGTLKWFGLHVYDARLYVPERGFDAADFASHSFALEITYARHLSGKAIAERSRDEIEKLGLGTDEERAVWLREMKKLFPNVASGQTLTGVHLPNGTARFYYDAHLIGTIDDPAFGRAFFSIWLSPRTSAPKLRTELLQRAAPS